MSKYRIQYISNLFLNKTPHTLSSVLKPCAPILALCGNIGIAGCPSTKQFLKEADKHYERVLWIPGMLEYATSDAVNPITWREQADQCYKSIQTWKLKNTAFCQKYEWNLTNSIAILATPGWHNSFDTQEYKIYDYKNGLKLRMNSEDFQHLLINEISWIYTCSAKKPETKKIVLTYSPIEVHKNPNTTTIHLHGTNKLNNPQSYCGGKNPWYGINMLGSAAFRKDAFVEVCTTKEKFL